MTPSEKASRYLLHLAEKSNWKYGFGFNPTELGNELGFSADESERIVIGLSKLNYVGSNSMSVYMKHEGLDKAEELKASLTQQMAFAILKKASVAAATEPLGYAYMGPIRQALGISEDSTREPLQYLEGKGLIEFIDDSKNTIRVTASGKDCLIQASQRHPAPGSNTQNFTLNFHGPVNNSQVGQAGGDITQTGSFHLDAEQKEILRLVALLKEQIPRTPDLTSEAKEEVDDYIQRIEKQVTREKPNSGIIKTALSSLKTVVEGTAANAAATALLAYMKPWLATHGIII